MKTQPLFRSDKNLPQRYEEFRTFKSDKSLAQRFEVSRTTIWRWVKAGTFPKPVKLAGGTTRWRTEDIEAWENQQA